MEDYKASLEATKANLEKQIALERAKRRRFFDGIIRSNKREQKLIQRLKIIEDMIKK
jgi:hypothetical protein